MTRKERESLTECLYIIWQIASQMQEVAVNFHIRLPSTSAPKREKELILTSFSIVYVECQKLLQEAADKLADELQNVTVPEVPPLH